MINPYDLLKVTEADTDATIKQAYLNRVRLCPPDRNPEAFQALRAAYEAIATERDRAHYRLFGVPDVDLHQLLARHLPRSSPKRPGSEQFRRALAASLQRSACDS